MSEQNRYFSKTRIAPTPSGFLHLGNALSFALTAAIAEKTSTKILLRIDDLDRDRVKKEYVQDIFDTLDFLEIPYDEGPRNYREYESEYSQLHRMGLYQNALEQLKDTVTVFACTCSRMQVQAGNPDICRDKFIPFDTANVNWKIKTDHTKEISINTFDKGTSLAKLPNEMQDFVVRKKDGYPAYQLASLIDDLHFGVDLVVRGEDLWDSTLVQRYLASVLNAEQFQEITFHHHPLLMLAQDKKLSKSAGDTSIRYLRSQGQKPKDVYSEIGVMLGFKETVTNWKQLLLL